MHHQDAKHCVGIQVRYMTWWHDVERPQWNLIICCQRFYFLSNPHPEYHQNEKICSSTILSGLNLSLYSAKNPHWAIKSGLLSALDVTKCRVSPPEELEGSRLPKGIDTWSLEFESLLNEPTASFYCHEEVCCRFCETTTEDGEASMEQHGTSSRGELPSYAKATTRWIEHICISWELARCWGSPCL